MGYSPKLNSSVQRCYLFTVDKESACNAGDLVRSLDWEDPLEKELATHSSILAWKIPWTEEPGRPEFMGLQS